MIGNILALLFSAILSLILGYFSFVYFRRLKTGVKSNLLPDPEEYKDDKKSVGFAFSALIAGAVSCLCFDTQNTLKIIVCLGFCTCLTMLGFSEDKKVEFSGRNLGLKATTKAFFVCNFSLVLGLALMLLEGNTAVTLPFVTGKTRLGAFYPIALCLTTLVATQGAEGFGKTFGAEYTKLFVNLSGIITLLALSDNLNNLTFGFCFCGIAVGSVLWAFPKRYMKTALSDKYLCQGVLISTALITQTQGLLLFLMAPEILFLISKPIDKAFCKLTGNHIFKKLPISENLTASGVTQIKITLFYTLLALFFTAFGVVATYLINNLTI